MLFELRNSTPDVSPDWVSVRDSFLAGNTIEAFQSARSMRGIVPLENANDYLLNIEIARACSVTKRYMALVRRGRQVFPDDPE